MFEKGKLYQIQRDPRLKSNVGRGGRYGRKLPTTVLGFIPDAERSVIRTPPSILSKRAVYKIPIGAWVMFLKKRNDNYHMILYNEKVLLIKKVNLQSSDGTHEAS